MNAYATGYKHGYAHALKGEGKSYTGMGSGFLKLNFDKYAKEYTAGYDEGYRQGMKDAR